MQRYNNQQWDKTSQWLSIMWRTHTRWSLLTWIHTDRAQKAASFFFFLHAAADRTFTAHASVQDAPIKPRREVMTSRNRSLKMKVRAVSPVRCRLSDLVSRHLTEQIASVQQVSRFSRPLMCLVHNDQRTSAGGHPATTSQAGNIVYNLLNPCLDSS